MKREPAFLFYPGDWMKDAKLSKCSSATRGVWIDLLCAMHDLNGDGTVTGTARELAQLARTCVRTIRTSICELRSTEAAHVTDNLDGTFTLHSKRMEEDIERRKSERERKLRDKEQKESDDENAGKKPERSRKEAGKKPEKTRNSRARAFSDSVSDSIPKKTAAAAESLEQTPAAADSLREDKIRLIHPQGPDLGAKLTSWARCENSSRADRKIFYQVAALVGHGDLADTDAIVMATRAGAANRNKAGMFRKLVADHLGEDKFQSLMARVDVKENRK